MVNQDDRIAQTLVCCLIQEFCGLGSYHYGALWVTTSTFRVQFRSERTYLVESV
jgi:hypothetical protein